MLRRTVPILGEISRITVEGVSRWGFSLSARRAGSTNSNGRSLSNQTFFHAGVYPMYYIQSEDVSERTTPLTRHISTRGIRGMVSSTGVVHEFLLRLGRSRFDWSIGGQLGTSMIPAVQQTRSFGRAPYSQKRRAAVTLFQNPRPSVSRTHLEWRFILQGFEVNLR
jgi:hypothetical protein